jgi:hypothetical protein
VFFARNNSVSAGKIATALTRINTENTSNDFIEEFTIDFKDRLFAINDDKKLPIGTEMGVSQSERLVKRSGFR